MELDLLLLLQVFDLSTVADWESWLAVVKKSFGAAAASLLPLGLGAGWMGAVMVGISDERRRAYRDHFHKVDLWMQRLRGVPETAAHTLQMVVPDRELLQSEIYNDFMKPAGRRYALATSADVGATASSFPSPAIAPTMTSPIRTCARWSASVPS